MRPLPPHAYCIALEGAQAEEKIMQERQGEQPCRPTPHDVSSLDIFPTSPVQARPTASSPELTRKDARSVACRMPAPHHDAGVAPTAAAVVVVVAWEK